MKKVNFKKRWHMLFVPSNSPSLYRDVIIYKPNTVMFDLEDAIVINEKDSARQLFFQMIKVINYKKFNIEVAVRVNDINSIWFDNDIEAAVAAGVDMIRLPKVETKEEVLKAIKIIEKYENLVKNQKQTLLFIAIESAKGVLNAFEVASSSKRIVGIALGGMDYLLDLKAEKLDERLELLYARQHLLHVARALKINVFDCVYPNVNDDEGFIKEFTFIKKLGFDGKSIIHPKQIQLINEICKPTNVEILNAINLIKAFNENLKKSIAVFQYQGQMVDKPIIEKAQEIIDLAIELNLIKAEMLNE